MEEIKPKLKCWAEKSKYNLPKMKLNMWSADESIAYVFKYWGGRNTIIDFDTLKLLRQAFLFGCTDQEACLYADINVKTLQLYQRRFPEFILVKEEWKNAPILAARETIIKNLKDPDQARWFLERKRKDEFAPKTQNESATGGQEMIEKWKKDFGIDEASLTEGKEEDWDEGL